MRQARAQKEQASIEQISKAQDEVDKMSVDPRAFWDDKSTFEKIGLAIALGMAAYGGQGQLVMGMIQNEIDRNIDAQKSNIGKAKADIEGRVNVLNEMRKKFATDEQAELAARALYLQQVERAMDVRAMQMQASDPMLSAQILEQKAQVEKARAELTDQLQGRMVQQQDVNVPDQVIPGQMIRPASGGVAGGDPLANLSKEQRAQYLEAAKDLGKYAVARDAVERSAATMETTDGAGFGLGGLVSRVPVVGGYLIGSEGRDNQSHFDSAAQLTADAVGISEKGQRRYLDAVTSSATKGDARGGVEMMRGNLSSASQTVLNRVDPEVRRLLIQHNPNLFTPETSGKRPGQ
jgi:predicted DNA-binding WGR domain protein